MYCKETSDLESQYLEIIQDSSSYQITGSQLVITSELGSTLLFHKTPYGPTAVPKGI
jgi:heat shock protein HslJ